jgi:hypothetical protein
VNISGFEMKASALVSHQAGEATDFRGDYGFAGRPGFEHYDAIPQCFLTVERAPRKEFP